MKKNILLNVLCILMAFCLSGCKSDEVQSFNYEANDVTEIEIETGANAVTIIRNSGTSIEVSYSQDVAVIQDGIMQINIRMPGAGINFKEPAALIVSVPDILFDSIRIKSEVGSISINHVNTNKLTVETQYGDINLSGMVGRITAKSELGIITTELPIVSEIKSLGKAGQSIDSQFGDSDNEINLYTNVGTIELK